MRDHSNCSLYFVGGRDAEYAIWFMDDVPDRLTDRVQLTSDGCRAYLEAVEGALGDDVASRCIAPRQPCWVATARRNAQPRSFASWPLARPRSFGNCRHCAAGSRCRGNAEGSRPLRSGRCEWNYPLPQSLNLYRQPSFGFWRLRDSMRVLPPNKAGVLYMSQFRWFSKVLVGSWRLTHHEALCDALGHGQAVINEGPGPVITLRDDVTMENRKREG